MEEQIMKLNKEIKYLRDQVDRTYVLNLFGMLYQISQAFIGCSTNKLNRL